MKGKAKRLDIIFFSLIILGLIYGGREASMQASKKSLIIPTPAPAAGTQQQPNIAKGADSTLVVWSDNRTVIPRAVDYSGDGQGGGFDIYAARMDASGNVIDTAPIVVSEAVRDQIYPNVAWNGQNWLVAWRTERLNDQYKIDVVGVRVSPEGKILDAAPIVIGTQEASGDTSYLSISSDGVNWVVAWGAGSYESQIRAARIAPDGAIIDAGGGGKVLFDDTDLFTAPSNAKFAFANNQFLLVWVRLVSGGYGIRGQRFDRNLNPIDAAPFPINLVQGSDATSAQVATDGTNFFVIWRDDRFAYNEIYGTRVSAAGQVLDPNGILLFGVNTNYTQQGSTALCFDGVNYVAAYHARPNFSQESIYASRISPGGTLLTPNPVVVRDANGLQPSIAPLSNGVSQVVWTDNRLSIEPAPGTFFGSSDIFGARVLADGTATAPEAVSLGAPRETQPRIVFTTGGNSAAVFRSAVSGATTVFLQRFDAAGGAIDANPIAVTSGAEGIRNISAAWNGTDYLVVWELNTQIFGRRVAADGTPAGAEFLIMPGNEPDVAALGTQFLVVDDYEPTNHIRFAQSVRVDANGTVLGSPLKIGSNYDLRPRVKAFGTRWLAVWESDLTHDNPNSNIQGAFVNADGTSPGEFAISNSGADTPSFAVAGDTALVVWQGFQQKIYGRRIKADGTLLDSAGGIVLASGPQPLYAPWAAWDGSRFVVAYNDSRNRNLEPPDDVWATLVGLDGAILTPGGFAVSKLSTPEENPVVESPGGGRAVFGFALFDDKAPFSNYRIKLRRFPFDQDYSITVTPYSRQAAPGAGATYQVGVNAAGGFTAPVNLGIDGLPNGVTATFNPPTVSGSGTSVLTISTAPDTPENIYRFTVTATSGSQQSNAEIVLYLDDDPPPTGFSVTNLGTLGGTESEARAVNNNGQIVGYAFNASQKRRAFLYSNGQMQDLGTLGGLESEASDINDSGVVVGTAKNAANKNRAFVYNGTMQDLGTFGGDEAFASSINNSNQITGAATVNEGLYHAFRFQNNQLQDLGIMNGYYSYGFGINSAGKIVGYGYVDGISGGLRGFLYQTSMTPLGTLGGRDSSAKAINDSDRIVGSSDFEQSSGTQHAFLLSNNQMTDLGTLGAAQSYAEDINNSGQVVGSLRLTLFGSDYRAFLYDGTTLRNLNTLIPQDSGWILNKALGISNNGQIVGRGTFNSQPRAFLLSPAGSQNAPPTVEITSPTTNRNFSEPAAITVNASAFDADGAVVRVEFYADGNLIGASTSNPFAILWTGMAQNRTYTLTAKAIDDRNAVTVSAPVTITVGTAQVRQTPFDFDGDAKTDISIYRPSVGEWWYLKSSNGSNAAFQFGNSADKLAPGDYTGDGKTDVAIWRPSTGEWFILRSEDFSYYSYPFGTNGDVPAPADFDADGKTDAAVFRPSTGTWYINKSTGGTIIQQFGVNGDVPAIADYDGDGKSDIAVYRPSTGEWWINRSAAGTIAFTFGNGADKPVQGDYTGDGKADVAIWRPSTGEWFILRSENFSYYSFPFGTSGDIPAAGDYDGDGKFDATVFRPSQSTWYVQRSTAGTLIRNFGVSGDTPVPAAFVP